MKCSQCGTDVRALAWKALIPTLLVDGVVHLNVCHPCGQKMLCDMLMNKAIGPKEG